jgi:hypothetical protein
MAFNFESQGTESRARLVSEKVEPTNLVGTFAFSGKYLGSNRSSVYNPIPQRSEVPRMNLRTSKPLTLARGSSTPAQIIPIAYPPLPAVDLPIPPNVPE